ncbi:glycosyltransferase family 39 protein [Patescibacteria group bacterium]|nr:glycosyltransferase family 39 protein [Patescibacteria group bacterium]
MSSRSTKIYLLIFLAIFTRFFALNWGGNFFFHPDENNMASSLSQLSPGNLNPNFFAYGQFPLYLGYFFLRLLGLPNTFANSIFILRFFSATFSLISLFFFYKIYPRLSFLFLLIFTPGLIQLAHFGTTESLLILTFSINLYLAKLILKKPSLKLFIFASITTAIAIATKISGLFFALPIILAAIFTSSFLLIIPYILTFPIFSLLLSPYNLLAWPDFLSTINYETAVATGSIPVFYTTQFLHSFPYLFQLIKVFPYANSWPILFFAFMSIFFIKKIKDKKFVIILFITSFAYFLYFGQTYVKWTRFMSPLFFITPLLASTILRHRPKLLLLSIIPAVFFFANYFATDTRIQASNYLIRNIPSGSTILSESGNVVNLPVYPNNFNTINYDFYNYRPRDLAVILYQSDYILIPSRRVFKNYNYQYYSHLFDGRLGFVEIKKITPYFDLFLDPENAEETWSVFDRPTIRLYKKVTNLSIEQYENLL